MCVCCFIFFGGGGEGTSAPPNLNWVKVYSGSTKPFDLQNKKNQIIVDYVTFSYNQVSFAISTLIFLSFPG